MNPPRFDEAIAGLRRTIPRQAVKAVILFGSAARDEATEDSDLDLLVIPRSPRSEELVLRAIRGEEDRQDVPIATFVAGPTLHDLDRQLVESILREGKVLVGKMPKVDVRDLDLEPVRLVAFDLRGLPVAKKMRLARELFGYETRKRYDGKTYVRKVPGKLKEWGGRKIGRGTVLIPERVTGALDRLLRSYGAKRILLPMWIQRP